jgi:hypothetical protein
MRRRPVQPGAYRTDNEAPRIEARADLGPAEGRFERLRRNEMAGRHRDWSDEQRDPERDAIAMSIWHLLKR